jgi:hypothetical protein
MTDSTDGTADGTGGVSPQDMAEACSRALGRWEGICAAIDALRRAAPGGAWLDPLLGLRRDAWDDHGMAVEALVQMTIELAAGPAPEPYCAACGARIGRFLGRAHWHHFRVSGTATELYDPGHEPAPGWRQAGEEAGGARS